jgi:ComEC/Rec2-related protein
VGLPKIYFKRGENILQNKTNTIEIIKLVVIILIMILIYKFVNKDSLMGVINQSLPPREAGLLAGTMLGDKSGFDKDFYDSLKNSGLVHLVVASGSNVMLLVGGWIELMAKYLERKRTIIVGLVGGWWYVNMVGWEIPVVRAMLLVSIMYWAQLLGRKFNLWRGILLGVLIMVIGEPLVLTSVSFWLSIMAFLAVVTSKRFRILWVGVWITPILGLVFGKISLISPLANVLVIGLVELVTVLGVFAVVLGVFVGAQCIAPVLWIIYPGLKYLAVVAEWGGKFPILELRFNWLMLVGYYLILFYFLIKKYNRS